MGVCIKRNEENAVGQNPSPTNVPRSEMRVHYRDMYWVNTNILNNGILHDTAEIYSATPDNHDNDDGSIKAADSLFENNENAPAAALQVGVGIEELLGW